MNQPTPIVDIDVDTILKDAVPDPQCKIHECPRAAEWLAVLDCGHDGYMCTPCRVLVEERMLAGWRLTCSNPGHPADRASVFVSWIAL